MVSLEYFCIISRVVTDIIVPFFSVVSSFYFYILTFEFSCRTGKDNPPVTFAIAACETQNVSVTVLPAFNLSGENCSSEECTTAKDMWDKMAQVNIFSPPPPFSFEY